MMLQRCSSRCAKIKRSDSRLRAGSRAMGAHPAVLQGPPKVPFPPDMFPWTLCSGRVLQSEEERQQQWTQLSEMEKQDVRVAYMQLQAVGSEQPFPVTLWDGRELQTLAEVEQLDKDEVYYLVTYYAVCGLVKTSADLSNRTAVAMNDFTNFLEVMPEKTILQQISEGFGGVVTQTPEARDMLQHLRETMLRNVRQALRRHCKFTEILKSQQREIEDLKKVSLKRVTEAGPHCYPAMRALKRLLGDMEPIKEIKHHGHADQTSSGGNGSWLFFASVVLQNKGEETQDTLNHLLAALVEFSLSCAAATNNLVVLQQAMAVIRKGASSRASRPTEQNPVELHCRSKESLEGFVQLFRLTVSSGHFGGTEKEKAMVLACCGCDWFIDRLQDMPEAAAVEGEAQQVLQAEAETDYCQKEVSELKSLCKELKEGQEALTPSLRDNQNEEELLPSAVSQLTSLMSGLEAASELACKEIAEVKALCHELKEGQKITTECLTDSMSGVSVQFEELKARSSRLEKGHEALKSSLNAQASKEKPNEKQLLTSAVSQLTALVSTLRVDRELAQKEIDEVKTLCHELKEGQKSSTRCLTDGQYDKHLTTVATLVSMLQAEKAEKEHAQKEMSRVSVQFSELKAQYDRRKSEHEALKSSLNAEASKALADRAWQGHGGLSSASPASLSSWNVVASGSGGSQTILSASWISVATIGPCCFLQDAIFTIKTDSGCERCKAIDLQIGSQVVAENGQIIEVKIDPEPHVVDQMVELQTESACLQISPDHRIVLPDRSTAPRLRFAIFPCEVSTCNAPASPAHVVSSKFMAFRLRASGQVQAEKLFIGDLVMVNGHPEVLTQARNVVGRAEVVKLSFFPDLPVTVGHVDPGDGIASKGHKPRRGHPQRRGGSESQVAGAQLADDGLRVRAADECVGQDRFD